MRFSGKQGTFIWLAAYLILAVVFAFLYRYQWNTDGLGYLSIAQKYADGNFWPAVNGFWSPLYSWLVAVFIVLGIPALAAAKIVGVLAGLVLLLASRKLLECFDLDGFAKKIILAALVLVTVYFAVSLDTPDLPLAAIVVSYLALIFRPDYNFKRYGMWCGVLGGLAYLAKTYAFLFFAAHFVIFGAIFFWRAKPGAERKNIIRNFIAGMAAFALVSGVWAALISVKYGELTLGRTGGYNLAAYGPAAAGDPLDYLGFLPPADKYSLSAWDDPGLIAILAAKEVSFVQKIAHYARNTAENTVKTFVVIYSRFSLLALATLVFSIIVIFKNAANKIFARDHIYLVLTILVIQSGYLPIHIEERYIWVAGVLLLILAAKVARDALGVVGNGRLKKALLCLAVFSFALAPVYKLLSRVDTGREDWRAYQQLKESGFGGKIASNAEWSKSLYLVFSARGQYYGIPKPGISQEELRRQLDGFGIDYYLVWKNAGIAPEFLKNLQDISFGKVAGLEIYSLR